MKKIVKISALVMACCLGSAVYTAPAYAQTAAPGAQQSRYLPAVPDENILARLVWSTMVALDNANRTGDYSVLYALTSPQFQRSNASADLAASFENLRAQRVDVGRAIMMTPAYYIPPSVDASGNLRLRGGFDYRPQSIRFDLLFVQVGGGWRINAISVVQMDFAAPK